MACPVLSLPGAKIAGVGAGQYQLSAAQATAAARSPTRQWASWPRQSHTAQYANRAAAGVWRQPALNAAQATAAARVLSRRQALWPRRSHTAQ